METDALFIGYDKSSNEDTAVLTVGRRNTDGSITILNNYIDDEAKELYLKLTAYKSSVIPACFLPTIRKEE